METLEKELSVFYEKENDEATIRLVKKLEGMLAYYVEQSKK